MKTEKVVKKAGADQSAPALSLRTPTADDLFTLVRLIDKIGLTDARASVSSELRKAAFFEMPKMIGEDGKEVDLPHDQWTEGQRRALLEASSAVTKIKAIMMDAVIQNIGKVKDEILTLLASGYGVRVEDIPQDDGIAFAKMLFEYIDREAFTDFFIQASKLRSKAFAIL